MEQNREKPKESTPAVRRDGSGSGGWTGTGAGRSHYSLKVSSDLDRFQVAPLRQETGLTSNLTGKTRLMSGVGGGAERYGVVVWMYLGRRRPERNEKSEF